MQLADFEYHIPANIDILLNVSIFWDLICNCQIRRPNHTLILHETMLGWIISGRMQSYKYPRKHKIAEFLQT